MATYQPSEAEWNAYGTMFAASRFGSRVVTIALWGIQAFMVVAGVGTYCKIPKERRKGHLRFLVFSGFILATYSTFLVLDTRQVFRDLFLAGPSGRSYVEVFRADAEDLSARPVQLVSVAMGDLTIIGGDILMLWRCYVVWRSRRWDIVLPFLACVGTIISRVIGLIIMTSKGWLTGGPVAETNMISQSLSVSVNVMVTALILFQLGRTWSVVSKAYPNRRPPTAYSSAAAILTESAAPLTIFGICYVTVLAITYYRKPVILSQRGALNALSEVSLCLFYSFSALSPQMIIFRVLNGQSWKTANESTRLTEKLSTTLRFATPHSTSTDDLEADSMQPRTIL
ncbi:hypothetical protein BKA70DRAFT_830541 [Coprinopsis sp. MPI-PUGE-AT-0042]|nr:hypothetical protein BKA70DRAFT_830541 [Coprinopsis sp. MPI-PUGE-AT-0042]